MKLEPGNDAVDQQHRSGDDEDDILLFALAPEQLAEGGCQVGFVIVAAVGQQDGLFGSFHGASPFYSVMVSITAAQRGQRPSALAWVVCIQQRGHLVPGASLTWISRPG